MDSSFTADYIKFNITGPDISSTPHGPANGIAGETYEYFSGSQNNTTGNFVAYLFDWGDGTQSFSGWTKPKDSSCDGCYGRYSHSWTNPGIYYVKVKAYDICGLAAADWSYPLIVTISGVVASPKVLTPYNVSASPEINTNWISAKAAGGDVNKYWSSIGPINNSSSDPQWIRLDLGDFCTVYRIKVTPRANGEGFPISLKLQYSNDDLTWFDIPNSVHSYRPNTGDIPQIIEAGKIVARYVRLYSDRLGIDSSGKYCFQVADLEVRVLGKPEKCCNLQELSHHNKKRI